MCLISGRVQLRRFMDMCMILTCCVRLQDLYVMRRAVVIYERLIRRFTAQTTDYQVLLSTFAGGACPEMSQDLDAACKFSAICQLTSDID